MSIQLVFYAACSTGSHCFFCRNVCNASKHAGSIAVENVAGGCRFGVRLPPETVTESV